MKRRSGHHLGLGILLGFVLDCVMRLRARKRHSLMISLAIAKNTYGARVTIVFASVIHSKNDSLI